MPFKSSVQSERSHSFGETISQNTKSYFRKQMELNRRIFNSISMLSSDKERHKPTNVLFIIVVFSFQVTVLISSLIFCYRFTANDLENSLYALLQICVFLSTVYTIFVALKLRYKINELFDKVHQIQIDCEY